MHPEYADIICRPIYASSYSYIGPNKAIIGLTNCKATSHSVTVQSQGKQAPAVSCYAYTF